MMAQGTLNPVFMITHVGGLNAVPETTINLDKIPGGKKLIYTHKNSIWWPLRTSPNGVKRIHSTPSWPKSARATVTCGARKRRIIF